MVAFLQSGTAAGDVLAVTNTGEVAPSDWESAEEWTRDDVPGRFPQVDLNTARRTLNHANMSRVPMGKGTVVVGMLAREQVLHYIRVRPGLAI